MSIRSGGRAHSRRRRVLLDDAQQTREARPRPRARRDTDTPRNYSAQAAANRQPRVTDLIPTRRWTLTVFGLFMAVAVTALHALHFTVMALGKSDKPGWSTLQLKMGATLSGWTCSALLLGTAAFSVLVFVIRRHKSDDYRGRYRIWMWAAIVSIVCSVLPTSNPFPIVPFLLSQVGVGIVHFPVFGATLVGTLLLLLGLRIGFEVRASRASLALIVFATVCAQACVGWPWIDLGLELWVRDTIPASLELIGVLSVFTASVVFSRYVYLDSQGYFVVSVAASPPANAKTTAETSEPCADNSDSSSKEPAEKPVKRKPAALKVKKKSVSVVPAEEEEALDDEPEMAKEDDDELPRKLSKAERRKLRKQRRKAA